MEKENPTISKAEKLQALLHGEVGVIEELKNFGGTHVEQAHEWLNHFRSMAESVGQHFRHTLQFTVEGPKKLKHRLNDRMTEAVLYKRMPLRDQENTVNWDHYFAVHMGLTSPIERTEIFPHGTIGISPEEMMAIIVQKVKPLSLDPHFHGCSIDPEKFPEIIDPDFQKLASIINKTNFARTLSACSGHDYEPEGFGSSYLSLALDVKNPSTKPIKKRLTELTMEDQRGKTEILFRLPERKIVPVDIHYGIFEHHGHPHEHEESHEHHHEEKHHDEDVVNDFIDPEKRAILFQKRAEQAADYQKGFSSFAHSEECRAIRDEFWKKVQKIFEVA